MGRPKGYILSEDQKRRMQEGRIAAREGRVASVPKLSTTPVLVLNGTEKEGFDFWEPLRNTFRPLHQYDLCKKIEKEIVSPVVWRNYNSIINILEKYCTIRMDNGTTEPTVSKPKRERKYIMTEEHKQKIREARQRKGDMK